MKMRKKLAALLAATMIASVMPMTAFAASKNRVDKVVVVGKDDTTEGNAPRLIIDKEDAFEVGNEFYLKLENAEFVTIGAIVMADGQADPGADKEDAELALADGTLVRRDGDALAVTPVAGQDKMNIPLVAKITGPEAIVTIDSNSTTITGEKFVFAKTNDAKSVVVIGDVPAFYGGTNKIAKISIEESYAGAFANAEGDDKVIEIVLDNDDFEFVSTPLDNDDFEFVSTPTVEYRRGFSKAGATPVVTPLVVAKEKQVLRLTIDSATFVGLQKGAIDIIAKVTSGRKPTEGDLNVNISGGLVEDGDYKVATVANYGVELKSEKDYEFLAGRTEKVEFHLNEIVDDSMVDKRTTEFSLPEGVYFKNATLKKGTANVAIDYVKNDDDQFTGFTVDLNTTLDKVDEFKFEANLDITSNFEGDVVLKAEGRAIGEDLEVILATVKPAVKVTIEPMTVKVGLKEQVGGKVVIEELEKGALNQGKEIYIELETEKGVKVTDADVEVTSGDLKKGDVTVSKTTEGAITILIKRKSKEASTIELTNVKVKLDRTVPEGAYDIKVGGEAVSSLVGTKIDGKLVYGNDNIVAKDFLFVGERYTRPVTVFTIGSNVYTLNGEKMTMDAAAYIKDGRTMVPVRYLAYALGIEPDSIKFNAGIVTIFAEDGKVIQLKNGDKNLVINGMSIPMVAAAEIVEGRTYVPVTEIGGVFGVTGDWDAATQTATFK